MGKSISLPFMQLPDIPISEEDAYNTLTTGGLVRVKLSGCDSNETFCYLKEHPRRRGKFIYSFNKSFRPNSVFCIIRNKQMFLDRYYMSDIFYLFYK